MRTILKIVFSIIAVVLLIATSIIMLPVAFVSLPIRYFGKTAYRNWLLFVVSVLLKLWLFPLAFIYRMTYKGFWQYLYKLAILNDISGNIQADYLFNDVFLKDKTIEPYGKYETVSDNTGDNFLKQNLSITGQIFTNILNAIDKNHVVKSATQDKK